MDTPKIPWWLNGSGHLVAWAAAVVVLLAFACDPALSPWAASLADVGVAVPKDAITAAAAVLVLWVPWAGLRMRARQEVERFHTLQMMEFIAVLKAVDE